VIETEVPPPDELSLLTTAELAERITTTHVELVERETRILQLGCAWADVHDIDSTDLGWRIQRGLATTAATRRIIPARPSQGGA
jgi:hypothetical protein